MTDATVARLSAKPWAVSAPEGADLRTVASVSSAAKNKFLALPDDEPVGIPPPFSQRTNSPVARFARTPTMGDP